MVAHEFPWDMNQALSFALFRTYAVPTIGGLLARTGEFLERTQQRYDDTTLILDAVVEHGFGSASARDAFRRMNQMHGAYPISNDDLRYVLSTFVVVPIRWIDSYGWRRFTETEKVASANYYRRLGTHMNIKAIPATYQDFIALADAYEREHFGFDEGGRAVAESTLKLLATFPPSNRIPAPLVRRASFALMDDALLRCVRVPAPEPAGPCAGAGRAGRSGPGRSGPSSPDRAAIRPTAPEPAQLPRRLRRRPARNVSPPAR